MLNKVCIQGRLTKDPEVRNTSNQIAYCSFTIACERPFKDNSGQRQSDFINCVAWRNTATFIGQYFRKGDMTVVSGSIQTRSYDDNQGQKRYVTEIVVDEANFCTGKSENNNTQQTSQPKSVYQEPEESDEELPFDI